MTLLSMERTWDANDIGKIRNCCDSGHVSVFFDLSKRIFSLFYILDGIDSAYHLDQCNSFVILRQLVQTT
jgi:hypothetical protein